MDKQPDRQTQKYNMMTQMKVEPLILKMALPTIGQLCSVQLTRAKAARYIYRLAFIACRIRLWCHHIRTYAPRPMHAYFTVVRPLSGAEISC